MDNPLDWYDRPIGFHDFLSAFLYSVSFDSDDHLVSIERRTKKCRRGMKRMIDAVGNRPQGWGGLPQSGGEGATGT